MKTNTKIWTKVILMMCSLFMAACDSSTEPMGSGQVEFEITDAPIDDAYVKGVFVTVTDVKVNGQSIAGFSGKQTINLKAYQEGATKLLGTATLDAKAYSSLTLVLDMNQDANGNAPGCYVLTADNAKYKLATTVSSTAEITLTKTWAVKNNATTRVILDVDLRKAVRYANDAAHPYAFAAGAELQSAVRVVTKEQTGTINGTFSGDYDSDSRQVIAYAYKRGTFNTATETNASDGVMFRNAVNSTLVKVGALSKTYTLAFMEEGDYEIVFAVYSKNAINGRYSFDSVLTTNTSVNGSVSNFVTVKAGLSITISAIVSGSL